MPPYSSNLPPEGESSRTRRRQRRTQPQPEPGCRKFIGVDGCYLKGSFKGEILAAVAVDPDNGIYHVAWAVVAVENSENWKWFIHLVKQDLEMDTFADQWVIMTDQQKGLLNAIEEELPEIEHRLCVKHLHSNWGKKYQGGAFKSMMWEAARASNEPYHEAAMEKIKAVSVDAHASLAARPKNAWTRSGFKKGSKCDMLVNNWAEAFNICIMKARNQPILTLLNTIHQIVMARIVKEHKAKEKWNGAVCPRVEKLIKARESLTSNYICRFSGNTTYQVEANEHRFVVDYHKQVCSCGLWDLSRIPCVHAVCVLGMENKNPRQFVDACFSRETFLKIYSHFLRPIGGPMFWPVGGGDDIIPPFVRVLPGRPKRNRRMSAEELREKKENAKKQKQMAAADSDKPSRKGQANHCRICKKQGHNIRGCPLRTVGQGSSQTEAVGEGSSQTAGEGSSMPSRVSMSQPADQPATVGDGNPREQPSSSQPLRKSSRTRQNV